MNIDVSVIKEIEKALSIELFQHQRDYLANGTPMHGGRGNGKTLAHCIKLVLSEGIPLNIDLPELFCDDDYGSENNKVNYARSYYRRMFQEVWEKLKATGFPVRGVVFRPKEGTTYDK